jgi:hypothetical protein
MIILVGEFKETLWIIRKLRIKYSLAGGDSDT